MVYNYKNIFAQTFFIASTKYGYFGFKSFGDYKLQETKI